mmetsp:Transcript_3905/g.14497  ORF Transcript_3905/g.14497 Transcript_3905/m.14497 type:complete len:203 (-) Transcript_3905:315-923(-)
MASGGAGKAEEEGGARPTSPFARTVSAMDGSEAEGKTLPAKFSGLSVDTSPAEDLPGREFKAGIMIVGRRIRGPLKRKGTSGFRMFKDKYFMLHNGKILQFDSEKQYMSGYIPTPDQTTYVNLYDLDAMESDKKFTFRLIPKHVSEHTSKTLVFRGADDEAKAVWVDALTAVPELVVMTPAQIRERGPYADDSGSGSDEEAA